MFGKGKKYGAKPINQGDVGSSWTRTKEKRKQEAESAAEAQLRKMERDAAALFSQPREVCQPPADAR